MNPLKNSKEIDYKKTATSIVKFNFTLFFSSKFHICKRKILKCITRKIYLLSRIIYFCKFLKCKCFWISEYYNDSTHKKVLIPPSLFDIHIQTRASLMDPWAPSMPSTRSWNETPVLSFQVNSIIIFWRKSEKWLSFERDKCEFFEK